MTDIAQYSPEWHAIRLGKVTASRVADVIAKTKTGWGASRANYAAELIAERLTGKPAEGYTNAAMQWGLDHEADARAAYEFRTDSEVALIGYAPHPKIEMAGASPDGLVGDDGLVEFKCPNTATHIDTLLGPKRCPEKYVTQVMWQMACTGRKWCDLVSFDPRLPEAMRLYIHRIERSDPVIASLETDVIEFLDEIDRKVAELNARYALQRAA